MGTAIATTALVTMLIVIIEHFLPWRALLGKELPRLAAYGLGILSIMLPLTALIALTTKWENWLILITVWSSAISAGIGTCLAWALDYMLKINAQNEALEKERNILMRGVDGTKNNICEAQREEVEGDLAVLGNAMILLELVAERVNVAARYDGQGKVLMPALDDLERCGKLLRRASERISRRHE